ncbi:MAG: hypothetical protein PHG85_06020 [Candidatus Altiarchaeota archaeon]|nr:hypothetical protein [Candidatus Altiarchaeota archaeon]
MAISISRKAKRKKGQSAVEYLASNAWVVVIAMIALIVLWQIGVFTPPVPRRGSIGFSQLVPLDWVVSTQDIAYMSIRNDAGVPVRITTGGMNLTVYDISCNAVSTPASPVTISPGSRRLFVFYCTEPPRISDRFRVGDYYEGDLKIDYTNIISTGEHESVGKIFGPIEGRVPFGPTTTTTLPGLCGEDCTDLGMINAPECLEAPPVKCPYCNTHGTCVPKGSCGDPCSPSDPTDCDLTCTYCNETSLVCEEGDCGDPCMTSAECVVLNDGCDVCINQKCSKESSCGDPCDEVFGGTVDPLECEVECEFCQKYTLECVEQGDCGQPCLSNSECDVSCCYCSPANTCEQGDCGKSCTADDQCTMGCASCIGGTCRDLSGRCEPPPSSSSTSSITSSTSSSSSSTAVPGFIIVQQVYPPDGAILPI